MDEPLKILLLEDNPSDAEIVQRLLLKSGFVFDACLAVNRAGYIDALDKFQPDLIISDNTLPGFNATEALEIYHQRSLDIPFILVTGTVSEEFAVGIIKLGADDYVLKDRLQRLPTAIEAAIQKKKAEIEKKAIAHEREFDRKNLNALINNTKDLMWSVDRNLRLITCNNAFNEVIVYTTGKPLSRGDSIISTQFTEDQISRYRSYYQRALSGETFTLVDYFSRPVEFWSEISFYPILENDEVVGTACFSRDITERIKSQHALQKMKEAIADQKVQEQKKITRAVIKAQEKERNRIGQELHDNVNQILAATKIFLGRAAKDDASKAIIKYPIELIDNSIEEIRLLSGRNVTPLKDVNLIELIKTLIEKMKIGTNINVVFACDIPDNDLDDDLKLNIYRIIQEQINNIIKYAAAENVNILVNADAENIFVTTTDDGKGFDTHTKRTGIGLTNMINRIESYNGHIDIESSPGHGCKIQLIIPHITEE
jgi:two-component system sensor histidine kinase UhpB